MSDNIFDKEVTRAAEELENQGDDFTPEMEEQIRQIEALARMDESFANSQEYQDLMATLNASGQASEEGEEEEEEDYEEDDDEEEEEEDDDVFGVTKQVKGKKEVRLNFEPTKEMINFISSNYGIKDASTFFNSVGTWREQAQKGSEIEKEYDALTADLQAMPPEIRNAVQLWADGEDYTQALTMEERLDFSSDFNNQDVENLVQHYLPEEYDELAEAFENGELEEEDLEERLLLLARTTKRMFTEDKRALEDEREQYALRQKNEFQNMKKSALLSVDNLSKAYPNFSKSEISKIRSTLVEGKVDSLFMNPDGSYKDNAAELIAFASYGKKMLESVKKAAQRRGESEANMAIVDKSPKTLKKQKAAGGNQSMNMKGLGHLTSVFKEDPYA
jgi:hypothetical protein